MFDEERALDAAMRAFWENGYEATSTQDLCVATGLGRSSIYNTFSSKHDLFHRALARYMRTMNASQAEILEGVEQPPLERVRALLARIVETETAHRTGGHSIGCLTVNTTVELAGRDPESARMLQRDADTRLALLREVLEAGQRDGTVSDAQGADALARYVNAVIGGMRISAQGGADRAALESIAAVAMEALTP